MDMIVHDRYQGVIDSITALPWEKLTPAEMTAAAWGYYYFSIQFRENLEQACALFPYDQKLQQLKKEECDTANLSPWPGVAEFGERMNHDEFMRRALALVPIDADRVAYFVKTGESYLAHVRAFDPVARATSIASYEDGGLERTFKAMLRFPDWSNPLLKAFQHFLVEHIRFDSDPEQGHGALSRHLAVDDRVLPFWEAFKDILVTCVPSLAN